MLQVVSKKVALDLINLYFGHSIYIYIYIICAEFQFVSYVAECTQDE